MDSDSRVIDMGGPYYGSVKLWGDGSAMMEFLHVDDLAEACYVCMQDYDEPEHINVGTGEDVTIKELAHTISDIVNENVDYTYLRQHKYPEWGKP